MADTQTAPNSLPLPPVGRLGHGSFTQGLTMKRLLAWAIVVAIGTAMLIVFYLSIFDAVKNHAITVLVLIGAGAIVKTGVWAIETVSSVEKR